MEKRQIHQQAKVISLLYGGKKNPPSNFFFSSKNPRGHRSPTQERPSVKSEHLYLARVRFLLQSLFLCELKEKPGHTRERDQRRTEMSSVSFQLESQSF